MLVYAAFAWYKPVTLLPKSHYSATDSGDAALAFASDMARTYARQSANPELTSHFRPAPGRERPFERVLSSRADLDKWRAFVTYSQTTAVAASLSRSPKTIEPWLKEKYEAVWYLLQHASKYMDITYAGIAEPDPWHDNGKRQDRQGAIHQFARSQSWFFNDPVVRRHFSAS